MTVTGPFFQAVRGVRGLSSTLLQFFESWGLDVKNLTNNFNRVKEIIHWNVIYQVTITVSPKANGDGDLQKELKASSDEHGVVLKDIWLDEVLLDRLIQQHEMRDWWLSCVLSLVSLWISCSEEELGLMSVGGHVVFVGQGCMKFCPRGLSLWRLWGQRK